MSPLAAAIIAVAAWPTLIHGAVASNTVTLQTDSTQNCSPADTVLCPVCDRNNIVDAAGHEYTITCDYEVEGNSEDDVDGSTSTSICMEACDENKDCFGINFASSGGCSIVKGEVTGMTRRVGYSNMLRIVPNTTVTTTSTSETTSYAEITSTVYGPGVTSTTETSTSLDGLTSTTTDTSATSTPPVISDDCDLELENLCPKCNNVLVQGKGGKIYRILCGKTLVAESSNATYSIQQFSSPESCLADCADFPQCRGAIFSDGQDCELAKASDVHPARSDGYTAFLPVTATTTTPAPTARAVTTTSFSEILPPPRSVTILPISSGCDLTALSCPACDGVPVDDQLNGTYTVVCDFQPICDSVAKTRNGILSQEACMQGCDQDVTCLAAMFYPQNGSCSFCQQGMDEGIGTNLPYIVLVADIDGDNNVTSTTTTTTTTSLTPYLPTYTSTYLASTTAFTRSQSITDFPAPFPTTTSAGSSIGAVQCPAFDGDVYVEPSSDKYFAVGCDSQFTAAHSQYISASGFEACAASCHGQCDGVQFGYSTRCGLYTDISVVGPAAGWTIAASITFATPTDSVPAITTSAGPAGYSEAAPTSQSKRAL